MTTNNFSSLHNDWCIKNQARLFINLLSIVIFSEEFRQGVPYEAENWHGWSHQQYFLKRVLLNRAPSSTQLHPTSTQLHLPPPSSFRPLPSSLQYPQQYLNQNIARNWALSPNLGRKTKSCLFWLKIGTHGILEVLIPNPGLDFWNSDPKIHFWANLCPKIQSCLFFLNSISRIVSQEC